MSNELIIKIEANQSNGMRVSELNLDGSNITIDWGDSTIEDYSEYIEHEYSEEGEYTITITGVSGIRHRFLMRVQNVVEVIIPNNITSLPSDVFTMCGSLEKVVLPNGISSIGGYFCAGCANLIELNLPDGLEHIGTYFLSGCGLDEVIFPYGVSVISDYALEINAVSNVVIPKSVTRIGDYAFQYCGNLTYLEIPNSVNSIGYDAFNNPSLTTIKFNSETPPTSDGVFLKDTPNCSIHIPEGSLENYLNQQGFPTESSRYVEYPTLKHKLETLGKLIASNLTKQFVTASWDEGLTTLANKVSDIQDFNDIFEFDSTNSYTGNGFGMMDDSGGESYFTLKIPSTITTLGDASFDDFTEMKICEIPSSVVSIGNNVFNRNHSLEKIIFKGTTPPSATSSSFVTHSFSSYFNIPTTCVIEVPCNALSAYKSATNYPDPTVYTYQCILFDDKKDHNNSTIAPPITVYDSSQNGVTTINYDLETNSYELFGTGQDKVIYPINQLRGKSNFKMTCEVKLDNSSNVPGIGFGVTPPELSSTGGQIDDTYADIIYIRSLADGNTQMVYYKSKSSDVTGTTIQTINGEYTDWIRLIVNFDSSNGLSAQCEELDGTVLATITNKTISSQISDRNYGIFLRDGADTSEKQYIRNIKCIGY